MKKVLLFIFSIFILLAVIIIIFILNSPARELSSAEKQAALIKITGRKLNLTDKEVPKGDILYKGKYMTFLYPASAKIYTQMVNGKKVENRGALEYFVFDLNNPRVYVVTEVIEATRSITQVIDVPGVSLRLSQSDIYEKSTVETSDGVSGLVFDKNDRSGLEKTMFFYKNGKVYSFSIISVDNKSVEELFNKILSNLKIN